MAASFFGRHLDGLICNAGALLHQRTMTAEGLEVTFATHLLNGAYVLSNALLPALQSANDPRASPKWNSEVGASSPKEWSPVSLLIVLSVLRG